MTFAEQIEIAEDGLFQARVRQAVVTEAVQIMAEEPGTDIERHKQRTALAHRALNDPTGLQRAWAYAVVANPAITGDSSDSDIQYTVNTYWDAFAGVVTSPEPIAGYLGDDVGFQARVRQAVVKAAAAIMADQPDNTPQTIDRHAKRAALANQAMRFPHEAQRAWTYAVLTNSAITTESVDSDIEWTVNGLWDAMAGVVLEPER